MKITAPAKLNLFLHITGRREDHFHLLESLFVFTDFGDEITISAAENISLTISDSTQSHLHNESINHNLIYRAALLLKEKYAVLSGAHIHLHKKIPVAAGLGGGSSDAAATLKALNQFWNLQLSNEILAQIGLTLGADIPACIYQQPAFISGIGEIIQPVKLPISLPVLLVNPNQPLSTQPVFRAYQKNNVPFHASVHNSVVTQLKNWESFKKMILENDNDLQSSAIALLPDIEAILSALTKQPGCEVARMSGSGPTCFALFSDQHAAQSAAKTIAQTYPNYWVLLTHLSL